MILQGILLAVPLSLLWIILANDPTLEGFAVGYVFGFAIFMLIRMNTGFNTPGTVHIRKLPSQIGYFLLYTVTLARDVLLSGIDVARRVIRPRMPINPGTQCIEIQDEDRDWLVAALSAHSITITPGELVIDFDECGEGTLYVHALDVEASNHEKLTADQKRRVRLIKGMLGYD